MTAGVAVALLLVAVSFPAGSAVAVAADRPLLIPRIKYGGGGDWYTDPTSLPNLLRALNARFGISVQADHRPITVGDTSLFDYPILYLTGHGNVRFEEEELSRLRTYLEAGGLLWVDDCYGLDLSFRREMKRLFPDGESPLVELPVSHPIFHQAYDLPDGLPKVHEHDNKPPVLYAIHRKGRVVVLYTYETDIGCGLEDEGIHPEQTPEIREKALQFAINLVLFAMSQ